MKATPAICGDHLVPISECDCVNYLQELKTSAERLIQLAKEREGMKSICQFCGWEITKPEWYHNYRGSYACDNCLMDSATERERESAV
jgi:hypothetical protein